MLPPRFVCLLVVLLVVGGWCKTTKRTDTDYSDDVPPTDYSDYSQTDEDVDTPGAAEEPPRIMTKPESKRAQAGSTVTLDCDVANTENYVVMWKKDNEFLYSDGNSMTKEPDRIVRLSNNTLVIYNAMVNDSSDHYECSILTDMPISITHRLLVDPERAPRPDHTQAAPVVRVTPSDTVVVRQGENVTLGCDTHIQPAPEMKWFRKSNRLQDGDEVVHGNYITIYKVNRHHAGLYQCLADNGMQNPPHAAITVIVHYTPEIEVEHEWVHTGTGIESEMTCIVHAHPRARVTWYKDQKEIIPKKGRIAMRENKSRHSLKIIHTTERDLGEYTCMAANDMGRASKTIALTGAPSQASIYGGEMTKDESGLILKWHIESYSPITEYKLKYRRKGENEWKVVEPPVTDGKGNQYTVEHPLEGLQPGSYEAILTARNAFGWSKPSVPHPFSGEYGSEEAENVRSSAPEIRPLETVTALLLVVSLYVFRSL